MTEENYTDFKIYWNSRGHTCYWCDLNGKKGVAATWLLKKAFTDLATRWVPACDGCAVANGPYVQETIFWPEGEK